MTIPLRLPQPSSRPNTQAELTAWLVGSQMRAIAEGGDPLGDTSPLLLLVNLPDDARDALAAAGATVTWYWLAAGYNAEPE